MGLEELQKEVDQLTTEESEELEGYCKDILNERETKREKWINHFSEKYKNYISDKEQREIADLLKQNKNLEEENQILRTRNNILENQLPSENILFHSQVGTTLNGKIDLINCKLLKLKKTILTKKELFEIIVEVIGTTTRPVILRYRRVLEDIGTIEKFGKEFKIMK